MTSADVALFGWTLLAMGIGALLTKAEALGRRKTKTLAMYHATHPDKIARDPHLTSITDFKKQYDAMMTEYLTEDQLICTRRWAMWWVLEASREVLDRQVMYVDVLRDNLNLKCPDGARFGIDSVDTLLGTLQDVTYSTQRDMVDAQQILEGNPESRVPQKT